MIPMVDLKDQYYRLKSEIDAQIQDVLENTHFILGPNVQAFEQEAADYLGVKHAIGCASGTDALHLALLAAGVGPGDEVITSAFTFIATAEAIAYVGATPVFVDIQPDTLNIDPACIEAAVTDKTRAILPVHLFGHPADMAAIDAIAEKHDLLVIEDCAQSFGARHEKGMTGAISLAGCHSFFPSKNLGCYGDGGMITTPADEMAHKLKMLRNHGSEKRYYHDFIGYNSRLDEMQAAILRVKLRYMDEFNSNRRRVAHKYRELFGDLVTVPHEADYGTHVYHQYTILSERRDDIMTALQSAEIACAIYYPVPLHQQKAFADLCRSSSLPVTEDVAGRCLSLPVFPELDDARLERIGATVRGVFQG